MPDAELPLFPLANIVLFPNMLIPLHVFEPRYVNMLNTVMAGDRRFGIALIREGEEVRGPAVPHRVGTVAHIHECREIEPGRWLVLALGEERFTIDARWVVEERLQVRVEWLSDEPCDEVAIEPLRQEICELAIEQFRLLREATGQPLFNQTLPTDLTLLGFLVAANLPLGPAERQELLELTDAAERLRRVYGGLKAQVAELAHRLDVRAESDHARGSNGVLKHADHLDRDLLDQLSHPEDEDGEERT